MRALKWSLGVPHQNVSLRQFSPHVLKVYWVGQSLLWSLKAQLSKMQQSLDPRITLQITLQIFPDLSCPIIWAPFLLVIFFDKGLSLCPNPALPKMG